MADLGFSPGGAPTPKSAIIFQFFAKNCMKMKEFGPPGGRASLAPPLDPPMAMQQRIQDFPEGAPTPKVGVLTCYFAIFFFNKNCIKMKEFGLPGGGNGCSGGSRIFPRGGANSQKCYYFFNFLLKTA